MESKVLYVDTYDSDKIITEHTGMISCKGGDGTLLTAINKYAHLKKPFFGIAGGSVNFLMNKNPDGYKKATVLWFEVLKVEVTYKTMKRDMSSVFDELTETTQTLEAFNDVAIGSFCGWTEFKCKHKENQIGTFKGAGICISTSPGSTGLNKNNGGPVLALDSKRWVVTGMQTNRTVNAVIRPNKLTIDIASREPVMIKLDGSNHVINNVTKVVITKGSPVSVIFNDIQDLQRKRQ